MEQAFAPPTAFTPQRAVDSNSAAPKVARETKRVQRQITGLAAFRNTVLDTSGKGGLNTFLGMVQRERLLVEGMRPARREEPEQAQDPAAESADLSLERNLRDARRARFYDDTDGDLADAAATAAMRQAERQLEAALGVGNGAPAESEAEHHDRRRLEALVALYYEWNHRMLARVPMKDTMSLLARLSRVVGPHISEFERNERVKACPLDPFPSATAAAAAAAPLPAVPAVVPVAPTPAAVMDAAELLGGPGPLRGEDPTLAMLDDGAFDDLLAQADQQASAVLGVGGVGEHPDMPMDAMDAMGDVTAGDEEECGIFSMSQADVIVGDDGAAPQGDAAATAQESTVEAFSPSGPLAHYAGDQGPPEAAAPPEEADGAEGTVFLQLDDDAADDAGLMYASATVGAPDESTAEW